MSFLRINTNTASLNAQKHLRKSTDELQTSLERLSSGSRINRSSDDVAGLGLSEIMRAQIKGLGQAERNTQDAVSIVQVAEGGLNEVNNLLIRLRELAIQASSDTIGDEERELIDFEVQQLVSEIDRIANSVQLSGRPLLNGEGEELTIQVGLGAEEQDSITFDLGAADVRADTLGIDGMTVSELDDARDSLEVIDEAIKQTVEARAIFGAGQSRFNSVINTLNTFQENLEAANSRIRDADIADETAALVKSQILVEAGTSVLAQANMNTARAIKLIGATI